MAEYTSTGADQHKGKHGNGSTLEGGLTGTAGAAATGLMNQVKSRASSQVAAQQVRAADGLGTVASALRRAGDELRPRNESLASYADMAVGELEHLSSRIRDKEPGEYLNDIEDFARRRPTAFVGGAFLVGLGLARFLKSTQPKSTGMYGTSDTRGYSTGSYRAEEGAFRGRRGTQPWPESTGTVTPPAPGRTPTPSRHAAGASTGLDTPTGSALKSGSDSAPAAGRLPGAGSAKPGTSAGSTPAGGQQRSRPEGGSRDPE